MFHTLSVCVYVRERLYVGLSIFLYRRCAELTTLPPSCADCLEIWEPQGLSRPVMGLQYLCSYNSVNDNDCVYTSPKIVRATRESELPRKHWAVELHLSGRWLSRSAWPFGYTVKYIKKIMHSYFICTQINMQKFFFSTSNCPCSLFSMKNPITRIFCISGCFAVPINPNNCSYILFRKSHYPFYRVCSILQPNSKVRF